MLPTKLLPLALLGLSQIAWAQELPSSGSQIQQIPPSPTPQKEAPIIRIEPATTPAAPSSDNVKIIVDSLHVTGARVYSESDLVEVTGFKRGDELTLSDLRGMAAKIAGHYHKNGYFLAQAYLSPQEINSGAVTITVVEGQYGKVILRNSTNLSDRLVNSQLDGLNSGDVVAIEPLENRLLLLSDIPGVNISSTLTPGVSVGATDLIVDVNRGKRVTGSVDADNGGSRYTGVYRIGATVNLNNLAGRGDVASLRVLTSGAGLRYARASYQMQFGKLTAGVSYGWLSYRLGKEFENLHANGTAKIASVYGSYPLVRTRNTNLYAQLAYEDRTFEDRVDLTSTVVNKKGQALIATLRGDHRDGLGRGGLSSYALSTSFGNLDIRTPDANNLDAMTAQRNGRYTKLRFSAIRLQNVSDSVSLYAAFNGQLASKNLDISEKMELGGMNAVRAYPEGEAYGDQGYILSLEARMLLPKLADRQIGQLQLVGFVDTGAITVNKKPWDSSENHRNLSGAGVGINWFDYNNFLVRTAYAFKLGHEAATSAPDTNGRFWIQVVKYF